MQPTRQRTPGTQNLKRKQNNKQKRKHCGYEELAKLADKVNARRLNEKMRRFTEGLRAYIELMKGTLLQLTKWH